MKTYKLTPLEQLQMEQKRLREERAVAEQRMYFQLQYVADNWGSMLTKGISSSIKSKIAGTMDSISSSGNASVTPFVTKPSGFNWSLLTGLFTSNLPTIGSTAWKLAKPALLAFATKKITSMLFGKSHKEKKRIKK